MTRPLEDQVVVITGASTGIGRAAALEFAKNGARLVLAARGLSGLESAAEGVRRLGASCIVRQVDVSDATAVESLCEATVAEFGRVDTWINNAAVSQYALIVQTEPGEAARIVEVNLLGVIYGGRAALRQMERQGGGTIVNVASGLAKRSVPLQAIYSASKHGVKGFTESLRMEAERSNPAIKVCLVMPSAINTPFYSHARSKMGRKPKPIPPVYEPEVVAGSLLRLATKPQAELVVGGPGKLLILMEKLSPSLVDRLMLQADRGVQQQLSDEPAGARDNLFTSMEDGAVHGDYGDQARAFSLYTRGIEEHPRRKTAILGAFGLGALALALKLSR